MNQSGRLARWIRGCPPGWQLTRAVSEDAGPVHFHIETCPLCAAEYRRLGEVVIRANALAVSDSMSHDSRQAISARLLSRGWQPSGAPWRFVRRPLWLGLVGAAALTVVSGIWQLARRHHHVVTTVDTTAVAVAPGPTSVSSPSPKTVSGLRSRASVRAVDAARFTRISPPPDERILLQEGVIVLDVVPLARGERFRIVTDDSEVEVRGTHFEVSALHGRLIAVHVITGRVQVRSTGGALATLDAGDEWVNGAPGTGRPAPRSSPSISAERAGVASDRTVSDRAAPPPRDVSASSRSSQARREGARREGARRDEVGERAPAATASFDTAWSLLRKGDTAAAASAFAELERVAAGSALEEDASYWRAVAVARSGDPAGARRLFAAFLRRFPSSARRGEASVALGWLLLEAGQRVDARAAFEQAASDPSLTVRARAREGIDRAGH